MLLLFEPFKSEAMISLGVVRLFQKVCYGLFERKVTMKYKVINGKEDIYFSSQIKRTMLTHHRTK